MFSSSGIFLDANALFEIVAEILAVTVLIDERERDIELIEFTHMAMLHNHHLRPGKMMTREMFLDWFHAHKGNISKNLKMDSDNSYKIDLLEKITDKDLQRRMLSSMFSIAVCDYELHDEECQFIKSALKIWKTGMPTSQDINVIA